MSDFAQQTRRCHTRAEVQWILRTEGHILALRSQVTLRILQLQSVSRQTSERSTVEHIDLQRCVTSGTVTDIGEDDFGMTATVRGTNRWGHTLTTFVSIPDDDELPIFVDNFVLG